MRQSIAAEWLRSPASGDCLRKERVYMIRHVLFDLDGTLLPMCQQEFLGYYLSLLSRRFEKYGIHQEVFLKSIYEGIGVMINNDGSRTNDQAFWDCFESSAGVDRREVEEDILEFYENEFNEAIVSTRPTPVSGQIVRLLKEKGVKIYLATNPVFPRCATWNRIRWAGLRAEDFEWITTYETSRYCKPNVKYYEEILERFQLDPAECLMAGNDVRDDLPARKLGIRTYLVTDCLENAGDLPAKADETGTLEELLESVKMWRAER